MGGAHGKGVQARGLWNSSEIVSSGRAEDVGFELLLERVMGLSALLRGTEYFSREKRMTCRNMPCQLSTREARPPRE